MSLDSPLDGVGVALGDVVAGKYRVEQVLGAGAMGVVVRATHLELGEAVALKLMRQPKDGRGRARFLREARAAARIKSEHAVRVSDIGHDGDVTFLVMEHLEGSDLGAHLEAQGPLAATDATRFILEACEALAHAHAAGIVHRDLKPANLFLCRRPGGMRSVKVLDFGISKVRGDADGIVTQTGAVMGSPAYMAPEQWESAREADPRSDVWSLGAILYELLTGETPFQADGLPQLARVIASEAPRPAPGVAPELEAIIVHCLEKEPSARPTSVAELARALEPFAGPGAAALCERVERVLAEPSAATVRDEAPRRRVEDVATREDAASLGGLFDEVVKAQRPSVPPSPTRALRRWGTVAVVAALAAGVAITLSRRETPPAAPIETAAAAPPVASSAPVPRPVETRPEAPPPATATPAAIAPPRPPVARPVSAPPPAPTPSASVDIYRKF
jgi:hypothetical protein